jgi:peptidoglycan/LPS O-acetylase OafA/YrhL
VSAASRPPEAVPKLGRDPLLDGMRGVAALAVLAYHVTHRTFPGIHHLDAPPPIATTADRLGPYAVYAFFVLSGILVGGPVVNRVVAGKTPIGDLRRYTASRLLRIFPAWWVVFPVTLLLSDSGYLRQGRALLAFATLQQNWRGDLVHQVVPFSWSLAIEIQFYAFLPVLGLLLWGIARHRLEWVRLVLVTALLGALLGGCWVFHWWWFFSGPQISPDERPGTYTVVASMDSFAIGMLIALLVPRVLPALRAYLGPIAIVVGGAVWAYGLADERFWHREVMPVATGLLIAGLLLARELPICALLQTRALRHVGERTYGVYLWHLPLRYAGDRLGLIPADEAVLTPVAIALVLVATLVAAELSWRLVEQPALHLVDRIAPRREAPDRRTGDPAAAPAF